MRAPLLLLSRSVCLDCPPADFLHASTRACVRTHFVRVQKRGLCTGEGVDLSKKHSNLAYNALR